MVWLCDMLNEWDNRTDSGSQSGQNNPEESNNNFFRSNF